MTNEIGSNYAKALVLVSSNGKDKILSGILERLEALESENEVYSDFLERLEQQGFVEWHDTKHSASHSPQLPKLKLGPVLDRVAKKKGLKEPQSGDVNQGDSGQIRRLKGELINLMLEKRDTAFCSHSKLNDGLHGADVDRYKAEIIPINFALGNNF